MRIHHAICKKSVDIKRIPIVCESKLKELWIKPITRHARASSIFFTSDWNEGSSWYGISISASLERKSPYICWSEAYRRRNQKKFEPKSESCRNIVAKSATTIQKISTWENSTPPFEIIATTSANIWARAYVWAMGRRLWAIYEKANPVYQKGATRKVRLVIQKNVVSKPRNFIEAEYIRFSVFWKNFAKLFIVDQKYSEGTKSLKEF